MFKDWCGTRVTRDDFARWSRRVSGLDDRVRGVECRLRILDEEREAIPPPQPDPPPFCIHCGQPDRTITFRAIPAAKWMRLLAAARGLLDGPDMHLSSAIAALDEAVEDM